MFPCSFPSFSGFSLTFESPPSYSLVIHEVLGCYRSLFFSVLKTRLCVL
jgi:hypothetical protein